MKPYSALSKFYDLLMYDFDHKGIIEKVEERYNFNGKKGLDLCCGTGTAALILASKGAAMAALDISSEMLNIATEKAAKVSAKITFILGDINKLEYGSSYDFICSVCDGLNYLKPDKFTDFLQKSYNALNSGGLLFFDISTLYKADKLLDEGIYFEDREELTYVYTTKYDAGRACVDSEVLIFEHKGKEEYTRTEERSRQYFYATDYILGEFAKIGFSVQIYDGDKLSCVKPDSFRLLMLAHKD